MAPQKAGNVELEVARGWRLCTMSRVRTEIMRGGPVDDEPRAVGGYARLELMHGFEIWVVSGPSFPQVEASTKWSL